MTYLDDFFPEWIDISFDLCTFQFQSNKLIGNVTYFIEMNIVIGADKRVIFRFFSTWFGLHSYQGLSMGLQGNL